MWSKFFSTLRYACEVRGYNNSNNLTHQSLPTVTNATTFPSRMGCTDSDRFTIPLYETEYPGGISLAEFHAAFLCSPLFQFELWIHHKFFNVGVDAVTMQPSHLHAVAMGDQSSVGPWTAWAVEGSRTRPVVSSHLLDNNPKMVSSAVNTPLQTQSSACLIMRCRIHDKPFCDTWWAVELSDVNNDSSSRTCENKVQPPLHPQLAFGTALTIMQRSGEWDSQTNFLQRISLRLLDPFHRLYSRLLLGSAKAVLIAERKKM